MKRSTKVSNKLILPCFLLFLLHTDMAMARGYYHHVDLPDWASSFFYMVLSISLLVYAAVEANCSWNEKNFYKFIMWLVVVCLSCVVIVAQINWMYIIGLVGLGFFWLLLCFGLFIAGFVLKLTIGVFSKSARRASTDEFIEAAATKVGEAISAIMMIFVWGLMVIGIPVTIISALFGLWK